MGRFLDWVDERYKHVEDEEVRQLKSAIDFANDELYKAKKHGDEDAVENAEDNVKRLEKEYDLAVERSKKRKK